LKLPALVGAVAERLPHAQRVGFERSRAIRGWFAPSLVWCRDNPKVSRDALAARIEVKRNGDR
jgi:hypothetical protein